MKIPFSRIPTIGPAAAAGPEARRPLPQAPPAGAGTARVADPTDLVARALAILAEESAAWQARRTAAGPSRGPR